MRGLDRERGDAGAADRGQERVDLRFGGLGRRRGRATRAQVRTSSTGCTGFTRKSATRICSSRRATSASKACVTTTTGGQAPMRAISRSSACISSSRPASRSMIDDGGAVGVELVADARRPCRTPCAASICALAPKVERTDCSNAGSAVSTATPVLFAALVDRDHSPSTRTLPVRRCAGAYLSDCRRRRRRLAVGRRLRRLLAPGCRRPSWWWR